MMLTTSQKGKPFDVLVVDEDGKLVPMAFDAVVEVPANVSETDKTRAFARMAELMARPITIHGYSADEHDLKGEIGSCVNFIGSVRDTLRADINLSAWKTLTGLGYELDHPLTVELKAADLTDTILFALNGCVYRVSITWNYHEHRNESCVTCMQGLGLFRLALDQIHGAVMVERDENRLSYGATEVGYNDRNRKNVVHLPLSPSVRNLAEFAEWFREVNAGSMEMAGIKDAYITQK